MSPTLIPSVASGSHLAVGATQTFIVNGGSPNDIISWGQNQYGELGFNITHGQRLIPQLVPMGNSEIQGISSLFNGASSYSWLKNGTGFGWGSNIWFLLSNILPLGENCVNPIVLQYSIPIQALGCGTQNVLILSKEQPVVYGVGYNGHGELGVGSNMLLTVPALLNGQYIRYDLQIFF